jgi:hypothetical protein
LAKTLIGFFVPRNQKAEYLADMVAACAARRALHDGNVIRRSFRRLPPHATLAKGSGKRE